MAVVTPQSLAVARRRLATNQTATWTRTQVDAAVQAVADRLENSKATINTDIETAAPGVFNAAQKKLIFAVAALDFAKVEGA